MKFLNKAQGYLVPNTKEAISFYRDILGYSILYEAEGFASFDAHGSRFFLWEWPHIERHVGVDRMQRVKHKSMFAIYFQNRKEVDEAYQYLCSKNVEFVAAPQEWIWEAYAGYFVDPNGYLWEIWCWLDKTSESVIPRS